MAQTRALYYPTIDITNDNWLKTAVLYWDEINTIVPSSISSPYNEPSTQFLADEGVLKPIFVNSEMDVISDLADDVINYLNSNEGYQVLVHPDNTYLMHSQKLPNTISMIRHIHSSKLPIEIEIRLHHLLDSDGWLPVEKGFANFYMTLLANKLCEQHGIAPLTDSPYTSNLCNFARLDNQSKILPYYNDHRWRNPEHHNRIHQFAQGLLTDLSFSGVAISEETSLEDILKFKRSHQDELGAFRQNIEKLTKNIPYDATISQARQYVKDIYTNEFKPSYNNLKKSLKGAGIKTFIDTLMKVSIFSTSATAIPAALLGLSIPTALLAGAGISLIASVINYNEGKKETLRNNPYSYLLALNNTL